MKNEVELDEFALIAELFAPLATSPGAADLKDDVAELTVAGRMVVTADAIVEDVHFLPEDPLDTVAAKLVRVNVSDILAKGAEPREALLSLVWPRAKGEAAMRVLARGLGEELKHWGVRLIGGDTTSTRGPLVLSMTLTGSCGARGPVRRSGGMVGDDLWVTGTVGDGWLGLQAASGTLSSASTTDQAALADRYRRPPLAGPAAAALVAEFASASIDVSDGLIADAGHIAAQSGVGVVLEAAAIPLSAEAQRWGAERGADGVVALATGGDDYQILFAARSRARDQIAERAISGGFRVTRIGRLETGSGVGLFSAAGERLAIARAGWSHFQNPPVNPLEREGG